MSFKPERDPEKEGELKAERSPELTACGMFKPVSYLAFFENKVLPQVSLFGLLGNGLSSFESLQAFRGWFTGFLVYGAVLSSFTCFSGLAGNP